LPPTGLLSATIVKPPMHEVSMSESSMTLGLTSASAGYLILLRVGPTLTKCDFEEFGHRNPHNAAAL
jgi:hypothetical protein